MRRLYTLDTFAQRALAGRLGVPAGAPSAVLLLRGATQRVRRVLAYERGAPRHPAAVAEAVAGLLGRTAAGWRSWRGRWSPVANLADGSEAERALRAPNITTGWATGAAVECALVIVDRCHGVDSAARARTLCEARRAAAAAAALRLGLAPRVAVHALRGEAADAAAGRLDVPLGQSFTVLGAVTGQPRRVWPVTADKAKDASVQSDEVDEVDDDLTESESTEDIAEQSEEKEQEALLMTWVAELEHSLEVPHVSSRQLDAISSVRDNAVLLLLERSSGDGSAREASERVLRAARAVVASTVESSRSGALSRAKAAALREPVVLVRLHADEGEASEEEEKEEEEPSQGMCMAPPDTHESEDTEEAEIEAEAEAGVDEREDESNADDIRLVDEVDPALTQLVPLAHMEALPLRWMDVVRDETPLVLELGLEESLPAAVALRLEGEGAFGVVPLADLDLQKTEDTIASLLRAEAGRLASANAAIYASEDTQGEVVEVEWRTDTVGAGVEGPALSPAKLAEELDTPARDLLVFYLWPGCAFCARARAVGELVAALLATERGAASGGAGVYAAGSGGLSRPWCEPRHQDANFSVGISFVDCSAGDCGAAPLLVDGEPPAAAGYPSSVLYFAGGALPPIAYHGGQRVEELLGWLIERCAVLV